MNRIPAVAFALLVLCSGCLSGSGSPGTSTESPAASPSGTSTESLSATSTGTLSATPTGSPDETPTTRPPSPTAVITPAVFDLRSAGTPCDEDLWLHFWGLVPDENHWESDVARTAYYVPANASFHLVTYVDGVQRGVYSENNPDAGNEVSDGTRHRLNASFSGRHVVRVVAYSDEDGKGEFERGTDAPCLVDGDVVQAGPQVVNFSKYGDGTDSE